MAGARADKFAFSRFGEKRKVVSKLCVCVCVCVCSVCGHNIVLETTSDTYFWLII